MDLQAVAQRLDSKEKLKVKYRWARRNADGSAEWEVRLDKLLDVDCDQQKLFVLQAETEGDSIVYVKAEEAIEVVDDDEA